MFRIFIFLLIFGSILGGLIFINWEIIKKINKSIIVSIIAAFLALIFLILIVRTKSENNEYKSGQYKPARFENGVLKKEEIQ
jgi:hypothetical protein